MFQKRESINVVNIFRPEHQHEEPCVFFYDVQVQRIYQKIFPGRYVISYQWSECKVSRLYRAGQQLEEKQKTALETLPEDAPFLTKLLVKHRRLVGILLPMLFFELLWWAQVSPDCDQG